MNGRSKRKGDSIAHTAAAEYLTIGPTLGESIVIHEVIKPDANRFVWDPAGVIDGEPYGQEIDLLPEGAFDTGYRPDGSELCSAARHQQRSIA